MLGLYGPRMDSIPFSLKTSEAAVNSALATTRSSMHSKKPKNPMRSLWNELCDRLMIAAMRPIGLPLRTATNAVIEPCRLLKVDSGERNFAMLPGNGGVKTGLVL